jgi:hypothetical protein
VTLYKIGDRVRVVTLTKTGRVISVQTSTELDTLGTSWLTGWTILRSVSRTLYSRSRSNSLVSSMSFGAFSRLRSPQQPWTWGSELSDGARRTLRPELTGQASLYIWSSYIWSSWPVNEMRFRAWSRAPGVNGRCHVAGKKVVLVRKNENGPEEPTTTGPLSFPGVRRAQRQISVTFAE